MYLSQHDSLGFGRLDRTLTDEPLQKWRHNRTVGRTSGWQHRLVDQSRPRRRGGPISAALGVLVTLLWQPPSALAGDQQATGRAPHIRVYTGAGITSPSDLRIRQPSVGTDLTFEQAQWEHKSLSTDWTRDSIPYVGVRAGAFLRSAPWLSVSAEVVHFKIFAPEDAPLRIRGTQLETSIDTTAPMAEFVDQYQISNGVNLVMGNVIGHTRFVRSPGFEDGRMTAYTGFGAGVTIPFTRATIDGQSQGRYHWGRPATQVLVGASWDVSRRWDVSGEYKFTATTADGAVPLGDSRSGLHTHHVVLGVGFFFSR